MDITNSKFRLMCNRYGLDKTKAIDCCNVIVVPGRKNSVYVIFDKDYNVVDVRVNDIDENIYDTFDRIYENYNDDHISDIAICTDDYSVDTKISLGTIIKLTDKYKYDINYSTTSIKPEDNLNDYQKNFIHFLAFLRAVGDKYNQLRYQMLSYGFDFPELISYIKMTINDLNCYINDCIENNKKLSADEFIDLSGQINMFLRYRDNIDEAINLLLKIKGYDMSDSGEATPAYCITVDELINSFNEKFNQIKNIKKRS